MRAFISNASEDPELVRKLQEALQSRHIEASSMLDSPAGEGWPDRVEVASANADAFIFLLGSEDSTDLRLQAEWMALLRNDWDGTKPMIPVLLHDRRASHVPRFLADRQTLVTADFEELVGQLEHIIRNPGEGRRPEVSERAREKRARRLEELKDFAEALKAGPRADSDVIV